MKITIKQNNLSYERTVPTKWEDVTFQQFLDIYGVKDNYGMLSILLRVDVETLKNAKIKGFDKVAALLTFLGTKPPVANLPKEVRGYKIPKDLELEEVQIYEDLKSEIEEMKSKTDRERLDYYPKFLAMYACEQAYGKYDSSRTDELAKYFLEAPAVEVLAVGLFTQLKLNALSRGINPSFPKHLTLRKKLGLALTVFLSRMASTIRYSIWKKNSEKTEKFLNAGQ